MAKKRLWGSTPEKDKLVPDQDILNLFKKHLNSEFVESETCMDLVKDWIQSRRELKRRFTSVAVKRAANKINKFKLGAVISALECSIDNSYTGIFPESFTSNYEEDLDESKPMKDKISAVAHLSDLFGGARILGFNGYDNPEEVFFEDIYRPARRLGLLEKPVSLSDTLFEMMAGLSTIKLKGEQENNGEYWWYQYAPRQTMIRYIEWLADQSWLNNPNLGLFTLDSSVFQNFVRQESKSNNSGRSILYGDLI